MLEGALLFPSSAVPSLLNAIPLRLEAIEVSEKLSGAPANSQARAERYERRNLPVSCELIS